MLNETEPVIKYLNLFFACVRWPGHKDHPQLLHALCAVITVQLIAPSSRPVKHHTGAFRFVRKKVILSKNVCKKRDFKSSLQINTFMRDQHVISIGLPTDQEIRSDTFGLSGRYIQTTRLRLIRISFSWAWFPMMFFFFEQCNRSFLHCADNNQKVFLRNFETDSCNRPQFSAESTLFCGLVELVYSSLRNHCTVISAIAIYMTVNSAGTTLTIALV